MNPLGPHPGQGRLVPVTSQPGQPYRAAVRSLLRERLLDAAAGLFTEEGWRRLTMAKVAERAGVSRQTVYNEFGNKQQLAEQLIHRELDQFLDAVQQAFSAEDTVSEAVHAAVLAALQTAAKDDLLLAVLEGGHSGDTDLLPFIFQSRDLVDRATDFVYALFREHHPELFGVSDRLPTAMESLVRLVLSHISQPTRRPAETAADLTWVVDMVVGGMLAEATAAQEPRP
jgi:AcrR family transcriptional regulator